MIDLQAKLAAAIQQFWVTRHKQAKKSRKKDYGTRTAVTGGAQMDGFVELVHGVLVEGRFSQAAAVPAPPAEA